ncbi:MAG TPA: TIGR03435 family protein, partial [Bryobacteraceae bacterium]
FQLAIHSETRQTTVYTLVPVKPETLGPQLHPHPANTPCTTLPPRAAPDPSQQPVPAPGLPPVCGGIRRMAPSVPGRVRWAARNVNIGLIASALTNLANLDRPVIDRTDLAGTYDFTLEWTPEFGGPTTVNTGSGPGFEEALKQQLGLRLLSRKSLVDVMIGDHIARPSDN